MWWAWDHKDVFILVAGSALFNETITPYHFIGNKALFRLYISRLIIMWKWSSIFLFGILTRIKVTIRALILQFRQRAVKIIFITNTWLISECVSVMIIRVIPWSHSQVITSSEYLNYKIVRLTRLNCCNCLPLVIFSNIDF